jgi:2-succinyl-5-enolpyruvyl-6-hydroxy-3-cyclohexene-1-carboxylate synthase
MARPSTVRRQAPEVREAIGAWHREGRTLDEILDALDEAFGVKISRSALHRHVKGLDRMLEKIERSRQLSEAAVAKLGHGIESRTAQANIQLMQAALLDLFADDGDGNPAAKPMDAMLLAKAMDHLAKAARNDAEYTAKIRALAEKEATAKMEAATKKAIEESAGRSLSSELVLERVRAIYRGEA